MKALLSFEYKKIFRQNRWTMLTLLGVTLLFLISGTISLNNLDSSATRALLQFTAFSVIGLAAVLTFTLFAPVINAIQITIAISMINTPCLKPIFLRTDGNV